MMKEKEREKNEKEMRDNGRKDKGRKQKEVEGVSMACNRAPYGYLTSYGRASQGFQ